MSFKVVSGVCRPQTPETLATVKGIQRQTNRLLDELNKKLLFVDGRIGSKTLAAVNSVLGSSFSDCTAIASQAGDILRRLTALAESRNLVVVADPESIVRSTFSPPSTVDVTTGKVVNPSLASASLVGIPLWLLALAGGGGYYYFTQTPSGKKQWKSLTK